MPIGKLAISRGHQLGASAAAAPRLSVVPGAAPERRPSLRTAAEGPAAVAGEYKPVHDRLSALERLAKLRDLEVLTQEEFLAEKAYILGHGDELVLNEPLLDPERARGPSLLGRLLSWKFVPVGIVAGLALSYASQPDQTMRFFDETLRLLGA